MLDLPYNQFTGTVQVIKAVGTHIVLTFCQNLPTSQLFTIVLTRHPNELSYDVSIGFFELLFLSNLSRLVNKFNKKEIFILVSLVLYQKFKKNE